MKNVLILSSANGSNFEAIIKHFKNRKDINFKLLCNKKDAYVIKRAKKLKIDSIYIQNKDIPAFFQDRKFDLVVMAGFFYVLDKKTIETNTFINLHPSLLPKYKGLGAIKKAFINNDTTTGITIHYANEFVDEGEIIYQKEIKINPNWSLSKLENEIHKLEHFYYPRIIEKLLGVNVLVIGKGAREHVISEKISESKFLNKLYLADCNDGFSSLGEKIDYKNYNDLAKISKEKNINLVVVGAENYLAEGIVNAFQKQNISIVGPDKKYSQLESSKIFAKKIMQKYNIKTAGFKKITNKKDINKFISYFKNPIIKADGLAYGKGVYVNNDIEKVKFELLKYLDGKFDESSKTSLIEERLFGYEVSLFSFWDGENLVHFPLCQDFKQNDDGLNTGGLAAVCPINIGKTNEQKLNQYKAQLKTMLQKEKIKTTFIIYSGLMICNDDIYVLEYNVRLGDPEAQALLNYIQSDWLEIFYATANRMLDSIEIIESDEEIDAVVMISKGYPLKTRKNIEIKNIENLDDSIKVYFSNIIKKEEQTLSNGGRILTAVSNNKNTIYKFLDRIEYEEKDYKRNIQIQII